LKIDIGVHVDGYIADTAVTVCYDAKYESLVKAAETALGEAVRMARANTKASDIGRVIEGTIIKFGYRPIQNLSGHSLKQYNVHAYPILVEGRGKIVAQAEHTLIPTDSVVNVITL